jgi:enoyl-CoA hydratase/carnithine racemase
VSGGLGSRIRVERDGRVLRIVLIRPEQGNAIDPEFVDELRAAAFQLNRSVGCIAIVAEGKTFCAPDGGMSWTLPRAVGANRARDLILTNRAVSAAEAEAMGLATRVVDDQSCVRRSTAWPPSWPTERRTP